MAHTKGLWRVRTEPNLTAIVTLAGEMQLSLFSSLLKPPLECGLKEWEANAQLMAAAPEMFDVLRYCRGELAGCSTKIHENAIRLIDMAIVQAAP
jgi:hypothetical protein